MEKLKNPIATWDITISKEAYATSHDLAEVFNEKFKKWCFQLEKGSNTDYIHWQCRVSTRGKSRNKPSIKGVHPDAITPTSNTNKNNDFYVLKEETRVDGPWTDKDQPKTLTKQLELFLNLDFYPWQTSVLEMCNVWDPRWIDVIYDTEGNLGKSIFAEYLEYQGIAEEVPPYRNMEDIFQWVAGRPIKPVYIFDMPRGMKKDKLADFYSGIEVIKNGVAFEKRYCPDKKRFSRPRIFIFTNTLPKFELLSRDRWQVWRVRNKKLEIYEEECEYVSSSESD